MPAVKSKTDVSEKRATARSGALRHSRDSRAAAARPPESESWISNRRVMLALADWGIWCGLVLASIVIMAPLAWLVIGSFKSGGDFFSSVFLPVDLQTGHLALERLTLGNYTKLFTTVPFGRYLLNSIFYASTQSVLTTLCCAMGGYALAKFEFPGRDFFLRVVLAALIIPGTLLLAPGYQVLYQLGLLDTYTGLIVPGMVPAFGVYLFRQGTLNSVPQELMESARLDGCGEIRLFFQIVLPIVRPIVGAFMMITFLGAWNNFLGPQIVLQSAGSATLAVGIAQMKSVYGADYGLMLAGTVVSIAPVAMLFLLLQKEFLAGLTAGAVKG